MIDILQSYPLISDLKKVIKTFIKKIAESSKAMNKRQYSQKSTNKKDILDQIQPTEALVILRKLAESDTGIKKRIAEIAEDL